MGLVRKDGVYVYRFLGLFVGGFWVGVGAGWFKSGLVGAGRVGVGWVGTREPKSELSYYRYNVVLVYVLGEA